MEFIRNKYKIVIEHQVISIIDQYEQNKKHLPEGGGILLGQVEGTTIYVMKASTPNKYDYRSRYNFIRAKEPAQTIVDYEFHNSNKKTIYIGEWHTHPERTPTPSNQDKRMIHDQFHKNRINEVFIILLIKGLPDYYLGLYDGKQLVDK